MVEHGLFSFLKAAPKILLGIVIPILDGFYNDIAIWLNDKGKWALMVPPSQGLTYHVAREALTSSLITENYRLEEQYEDHLILKLVLVSATC